jgi:hypothetical protein
MLIKNKIKGHQIGLLYSNITIKWKESQNLNARHKDIKLAVKHYVFSWLWVKYKINRNTKLIEESYHIYIYIYIYT